MFSWFNAKAAKQFGNELAKMVMQQLPLDNKLNARKLESKREFIIKKMISEIANFRQREKLNFYKTAQIGNTFRWSLKEAGYDNEFIETLTGFLVTHL